MIVSHDLKLIFIHVHRTGGTTLENILIEKMDTEYVSALQHGNAKSADNECILKNPTYTIIGFVRNPWERMLSWYSLLTKNEPLPISEEKERFETFLSSYSRSIKSDPLFHFNQLDYFPNLDTSENSIKFYRFENFKKNVKTLLSDYGLSIDTIPIMNSTPPKKYRDYYTKNSENIIQQECAGDIAYFNYSF